MTTLLRSWDDRIDWDRTAGTVTSYEVLRGSHETDLSVVLARAGTSPSVSDVRKLWKERAQSTASPVLVVVEYGAEEGSVAALLGPYEDDELVRDVPMSLAERLIEDSLMATSPSGLVRDLRARLGTFASGVAVGLRNEGLFASHVLELLPNEEPGWDALNGQGVALRPLRGTALLEQLGYEVSHVADGEVLLERQGRHRRAAAVVLRDGESFDNPLNRLRNSTAVAHGLLLAEREGLAWLIVLGGSALRLYPADPDVGVGRKGQTQTFIELDLAILPDQLLGYVPLLFGPDGLRPEGGVAGLLAKSRDFAAELATRLRERIYEGVIPHLARAVGEKMAIGSAPAEEQRALLDEAYHRSMIVLFRLLFVAYAEDRRLLPYGVSEGYTRNALKTIAKELAARPSNHFDSNARTLWDDLIQIWSVIDTGDVEGWGVPAYNGGLFTRDPAKNPSGAATYGLDLTNDVMGPVLRMLLVDATPDGVEGPVDFRSLSVREFGTIYEGLLESGLDVASTDLAIGPDDVYIPAGDGDTAAVTKGEVYFHSRSGSRKATGSYFTKPFAVEHLLDGALESALTDHLARVSAQLDAGQHKAAARDLFDFRVADLSMGSAHFLVSAIDRIEARFSRFLVERPMAEVSEELNELRSVASTQLGRSLDESEIDDGMLLRRQIARRCIYGVDINEIAVELARLAVWIHTFVPGLPLSFLNHGLVWGNSLTGVGTLAEIEQSLDEAEHRENRTNPNQLSFFLPQAIAAFLERAGQHLEQLGALNDASIADVGRAVEVQAELGRALAPLRDLCDLVTAERTTRSLRNGDPTKVLLADRGSAIATSSSADELEAAVASHPAMDYARSQASLVRALHMPVAFPEVFRRQNPGFDVIIGNPPWEKLHVNSDSWWSLRSPGFNSLDAVEKAEFLSRMERERPDLLEALALEISQVKSAGAIVSAGPFPGIGEAHLDLFAAFCWRFWQTVRQGGRVGVVLPRVAMSGVPTSQWRRELLTRGEVCDLTTLVNAGRWVFPIHPQWTIALLVFAKHRTTGTVMLRGPFSSMTDYVNGMSVGNDSVAHLAADEVLAWSDAAAIPLLSPETAGVFIQMSKAHPFSDTSVAGWQFRPVQGDLNQTTNRNLIVFMPGTLRSPGKVPVLTGGSFNIWDPDAGAPHAFADPATIDAFLQDRRTRQINRTDGTFSGLGSKWAADPSTLPYKMARIAFRDVARATDSRTAIAALVPPGTALVESAPYLFRQKGSEVDEAYLLGIMSSIPFDWYARHFVELHLKFYLLATLPIPLVDPKDGRLLRRIGSDVEGVDYRPLRNRVVEIAGSLAAKDKRYSEWAKAVGVKAGTVKTDAQRRDLVAELDALVALLYGLSEEQLERVFATFHRGWPYTERLDAVKAHYATWSKGVGS